jgi:hypothetical protein
MQILTTDVSPYLLKIQFGILRWIVDGLFRVSNFDEISNLE